MISIKEISLIIAAHFIADFIFQTDKMALNKSSSIKWLLAHILSYTFSILIYLGIVFKIGIVQKSLEFAAYFALFNGATHFIIDFITSRIMKTLWLQEKRHDFFVMLGVDQALHMFILMASWIYFSQVLGG